MAHMRDKTVHCTRCHCNCTLTANLDTGRVVRARMPEVCVSPAKCLDNYAIGVFDRQFGERIISPEKF
jgi:hypothetical protein